MTKGDKILIIFMVLMSLISLILIGKSQLVEGEKTLVVEINGEIVDEIDLNKNLEKKELKYESEFGYNIVEINGETVRVVDASCPDKLDVKQGEIDKVGQVIVCLPNKFVLEIKGLEADKELDKISR